MNALLDFSRKGMVKRSEDGQFRSNVEMTEKTSPPETTIQQKGKTLRGQNKYHTNIMISFYRISFKILLTQFAFGIQSSEAIFSLVSIRCFSALKFSLAKMASESARLTSQNGISTSLRTSRLPLVSSPEFLHVIPRAQCSEIIIVYLFANQIIFKSINCNEK